MPINPATVQQLPGVVNDTRPNAMETFARVAGAGVQSWAAKNKADMEMQSAERRSVFPAMIQEGYVQPGQPGGNNVNMGGLWFQQQPGGSAFKQEKRALDLENARLDIKKGKQSVGELPKSVDSMVQEAQKRAMQSPAYIRADMAAQQDPTGQARQQADMILWEQTGVLLKQQIAYQKSITAEAAKSGPKQQRGEREQRAYEVIKQANPDATDEQIWAEVPKFLGQNKEF